MTERYNGYANYDTWNAALWLLNDEVCYYEVQKMLAFVATQQHKNVPPTYAKGLRSILQRAFGNMTPDGVTISDKKSDVAWGEVVDAFRDDINEYELKWSEAVAALPKNPNGTPNGIVEAAAKFRTDNAPSRGILIGYAGPAKHSGVN